MKTITDIHGFEKRQTEGLSELRKLKRPVLRRSLLLALVIGSLLPLILGYVTPFIVISISQLTAIRKAWTDTKEECLRRIGEKA